MTMREWHDLPQLWNSCTQHRQLLSKAWQAHSLHARLLADVPVGACKQTPLGIFCMAAVPHNEVKHFFTRPTYEAHTGHYAWLGESIKQLGQPLPGQVVNVPPCQQHTHMSLSLCTLGKQQIAYLEHFIIVVLELVKLLPQISQVMQADLYVTTSVCLV